MKRRAGAGDFLETPRVGEHAGDRGVVERGFVVVHAQMANPGQLATIATIPMIRSTTFSLFRVMVPSDFPFTDFCFAART